MENLVEIKTVSELRKAICSAEEIRCQVRFGVSENWVKLSKISAKELVNSMRDDTTPYDMEMGTDIFGTYNGVILWIG